MYQSDSKGAKIHANFTNYFLKDKAQTKCL